MKERVIKTVFQYLAKKGLENSSVRDLCKAVGISTGSLYYWFGDKDNVYITAGKYGISRVVDLIFEYTFNHTDDIRGYFDTLLDEVEKYKYDLRVAVQITASRSYGGRMRDKAKDFRLIYEKYAEKIMMIFGCTYLDAETFIYSIIAYVIDYALWDDREKTQMLLDNLHDRIIRELNIDK